MQLRYVIVYVNDVPASLDFYEDQDLRSSLTNFIGLGPSLNLVNHSRRSRAEVYAGDDGSLGVALHRYQRGAGLSMEADVEVGAGGDAGFEFRTGGDADPAGYHGYYVGLNTARNSVVLDRIGESLKARPREIKLAYINPVCDALFMATPWLQLADRDRVPWRRTEVAYYVSRA